MWVLSVAECYCVLNLVPEDMDRDNIVENCGKGVAEDNYNNGWQVGSFVSM